MEVTVRRIGGKQFEAVARGHVVVCDQPAGNGGGDRGMTPPELLLAALGSCAAYYAVEYMNARGFPLDEFSICVRAEKGRRPVRLSDICIGAEVPAGFPSEKYEDLTWAIENCLLHRTLMNPPRVRIRVAVKPSDSNRDASSQRSDQAKETCDV